MTSKRMSVALKYMQAANEMDISTIMALRTPNCTHHFHPSSLGTRPPIDNTTYEANLLRFKDIISSFPMVIKETLEDEKKNQIMIWAEGGQSWFPEAKDPGLSEEEWNFTREYIFIVSLDESGDKIEKMVEFLDTKATEQLRLLLARAMENVKKAKE
ncbi:hypothetical protein N431DRAFT_351433 [Stipitochalara longipes BDJ]|nr:hypothetical protein N431DRAFT_351433 [Stipitochalara longipes BDJ]